MKQRKTSLDAYNSITLTDKQRMYNAIVKACKRLKNGGTFEEIAKAANLEPAKVWKRLNEMVEMKILVNTSETRKTSSGRSAMVRKLREYETA